MLQSPQDPRVLSKRTALVEVDREAFVSIPGFLIPIYIGAA